jgi:glycosyltransferase involved in cell wall biosynthesis
VSATAEPIAGSQSAPKVQGEREWPRIALVTPVYNSRKYIEATIRSVLAQDYPNLDYFIVDGGSTDGTLETIRKYEQLISGWISEPDNGMYDALNKGFARTTGEIMGWISATDLLHLGGLKLVASVFRDLPEVDWINGRPTAFTENGMTVKVCRIPRWSRYRFLAGANRYIQQESVFWRRSLWNKAGGYVDASRRFVSDFELWVRFFRHAQLYSVDGLIGGYRDHADALGMQYLDLCHDLQKEIVEAELNGPIKCTWLNILRTAERVVRRIPKVRGFWNLFVIPNLVRVLYRMPGSDWPPIIRYNMAIKPHKWMFRQR